jgi:hypothetical protein
MKTAIPPHPVHPDWRNLYRAAILEPDKSVIRQKVCEAEAAVLARGRELFYTGGTGPRIPQCVGKRRTNRR